MHSEPGYCINDNHVERHNLWLDTAAQYGFTFQWELLARRYEGVLGLRVDRDLLDLILASRV
jgi:hypothetical protein